MAKAPNGAIYLLNNVDMAQYVALLREKDQLATELRELMKLDRDIQVFLHLILFSFLLMLPCFLLSDIDLIFLFI
jgi:hypothetical protein